MADYLFVFLKGLHVIIQVQFFQGGFGGFGEVCQKDCGHVELTHFGVVVHFVAEDFDVNGGDIVFFEGAAQVFIVEIGRGDGICHPELVMEAKDDADGLETWVRGRYLRRALPYTRKYIMKGRKS